MRCEADIVSALCIAETEVMNIPHTMLLLTHTVWHHQGLSVRCGGGMHSYSPVSMPDTDMGMFIDTTEYCGLTVINDGLQVRVEAGCTLRVCVEALLAHDPPMALETTSALCDETIAGAVSTGTHGSGATIGNISSLIDAIRLVTPSMGCVDLTKDDGDDFYAACVGLGVIGIISTVTLRTVPAY